MCWFTFLFLNGHDFIFFFNAVEVYCASDRALFLLPLSLFGMRQEKKWTTAPSDPTWRASPEAEKPFVPPPHAFRVSRFWRAAIPKRGDIGVACVTRYKLFACYYCIGGTSVAATGTKADATTRSTDNIRRNTRVGFA